MIGIQSLIDVLAIKEDWPLKLIRATRAVHEQLEVVVQTALESVAGRGNVVPQVIVSREGFDHTIDLEVNIDGKTIAVEVFSTESIYIGPMVKNNTARIMSILSRGYDGGLIVYNATTHLHKRWADMVQQKTGGKVRLVHVSDLPTVLGQPALGF